MPKIQDPAPRDRILDTAARLFYAHGIRAIAVDRVIEESNAAKATLYAHFQSKNALVEAYLRRQVERARVSLESITATTEPGPAFIATLFDQAAADVAEDGYQGCFFQNASGEHLDLDSHAGEIIHEYRTMLIEYLEQNVTANTDDERSDAARIILALYDGANVAAVREGPIAFTRLKPLAISLSARSHC